MRRGRQQTHTGQAGPDDRWVFFALETPSNVIVLPRGRSSFCCPVPAGVQLLTWSRDVDLDHASGLWLLVELSVDRSQALHLVLENHSGAPSRFRGAARALVRDWEGRGVAAPGLGLEGDSLPPEAC